MALTLSDLKDGLTTAGMLLAAGFTVLSPWLVAWLGKTFATKTRVEDLAQQAAALAARQGEVEKRLANGETRFVQLDAAIREACVAARSAKDAADEVAVAAEKVQGAEVALAKLQAKVEGLDEKLESIEHFTRLMVEGHMKMGAKS